MKYLTFIIFLFLNSCVDQINLDAPDQPDSGMLIQGRLSVGDTECIIEVEVAELYKYGENLPRHIGGAEILLENRAGQTRKLNADGVGFYRLAFPKNDPLFDFPENGECRISVALLNGNTYQSAWEPFFRSPEIDKIDYDLVQKEVFNNQGNLESVPYVRFKIHTGVRDLQGKNRNVLWELSEAFKLTDDTLFIPVFKLPQVCYVYRDLIEKKINIFDGVLYGKEKLTDYTLLETPLDPRFGEGFFLEVRQQFISDDAFSYFQELNAILERKGTIFDTPVGSIRTNIYHKTDPNTPVYGLFFVSSSRITRKYVSPESVGNPKKRCPLPPSSRPPAEAEPVTVCDNCLVEYGATLVKPFWWQ